jgi:hypothetical protein
MLETAIKNKITELQQELDVLLSKAAGVETAIKALEGVLKSEPETKSQTVQPNKVENPKKCCETSKYLPKAGTNIRRLYDTFVANPDRVFRYTELGNLTKTPLCSLTPHLTFMKKKGLLKHENNRWSLA